MWRRTFVTLAIAGMLGTSALAPSAVAAPSSTGHTRTAVWLLNHLTVGSTYHSGYIRTKFKLWDSEGNGCDARDEVLIRDAVHVTVGPGCYLTGKWKSPYDGIVTTNPTDEQVDHVVPLADAWGAGAWHWSPATREAYANDLGTQYDLLAVSAHSNESKSDRDPSEYLPPRTSFDCRYITDYVAVMWRWRLHISASLKSFLAGKLASCATLTVHEPSRPAITYGSSSGGGSSTPPPTGGTGSCTKTSTGKCIRAGEFCASAENGKYGYDANGRRLKCTGGHWHDA